MFNSDLQSWTYLLHAIKQQKNPGIRYILFYSTINTKAEIKNHKLLLSLTEYLLSLFGYMYQNLCVF